MGRVLLNHKKSNDFPPTQGYIIVGKIKQNDSSSFILEAVNFSQLQVSYERVDVIYLINLHNKFKVTAWVKNEF